MEHCSTYLVFAHSSLIEELFLPGKRTLTGLRFDYLQSPSVYRDHLISLNTDFDLDNNVLLRDLGVISQDEFDQLWGTGKPASTTFRDFARTSHPDLFDFSGPFVPYLGQVTLSRNAIPNAYRYELMGSFARPVVLGEEVNTFGYIPGDLNRYSFIPLAVGKGRKIIFLPDRESKNSLALDGSRLCLDCRLRTHLYPSGLLIKYVLVRVSAKTAYTSLDLIELSRFLSVERRYRLQLGKKSFDSIQELFQWADRTVCRAVIQENRSRSTPTPLSRRFETITCLNTTISSASDRGIDKPEALGILSRSDDWSSFSEAFIDRYESVFNKYQGEIGLINSESLVISFGPRAPRAFRGRLPRNRQTTSPVEEEYFNNEGLYSKYKNNNHRVRAFWSLISVFQFVRSHASLVRKFTTRIERALSGPQSSGMEDSDVQLLRRWVVEVKNLHTGLDAQRRRFYYRIADVLRFHDDLEKFQHVLAEISGTLEERRTTNLLEVIRDHLSVLDAKIGEIKESQSDRDVKLMKLHSAIHALKIFDSGPPEVVSYLKERMSEELWECLDPRVKEYLVTAEVLFCRTPSECDFSGAAIEYCKAIEVTLNLYLKNIIRNELRQNQSISAGRIRIDSDYTGTLTLGAFPYLLCHSWSDQTTGKSYSNRVFDERQLRFLHFRRQDIERGIPQILASDIQTIANIRNKAAHSEGLARTDVSKIRATLNLGSLMNEVFHSACGLGTPSRP